MRTIEEIKKSERERMNFVLLRDGYEGLKTFINQTYKLYRQARKTPYGKAFRTELIVSCVEFRQMKRTFPGIEKLCDTFS